MSCFHLYLKNKKNMNPFNHTKFVFKNIFELFLPDFLGLFSKIIVQIWRRIKKGIDLHRKFIF